MYAVRTIEFSPDGTKLAVARSDNIVPRTEHPVLGIAAVPGADAE